MELVFQRSSSGDDDHHLGTSSGALENYERRALLGQGGYGAVFLARDRANDDFVAIKQVGLDDMARREVEAMFCCRRHPSVIQLKEIVLDNDDDIISKDDDGGLSSNNSKRDIYLVMELADGDLSSIIRDKNYVLEEHLVRRFMHQLLQGVAHLHDMGIVHRDLKPANLLVTGNNLKIGDFGLCQRHDGTPNTYIQTAGTLWYLAPELLNDKSSVSNELSFAAAIDIDMSAGSSMSELSFAIDMWAIGCIMAELLCRHTLFPGLSEQDQRSKIFSLLGQPDEAWGTWPLGVAGRLRKMFPPGVLSEDGLNLLTRLLEYSPERRITAEDATWHSWFSS